MKYDKRKHRSPDKFYLFLNEWVAWTEDDMEACVEVEIYDDSIKCEARDNANNVYHIGFSKDVQDFLKQGPDFFLDYVPTSSGSIIEDTNVLHVCIRYMNRVNEFRIEWCDYETNPIFSQLLREIHEGRDTIRAMSIQLNK